MIWQDSPSTATPINAANLNVLQRGVGAGLNLWDSEATPSSVTDWGAVMNAYIAADTRDFVFDAGHDFPFTTKIDGTGTLSNGLRLSGTQGFAFENEGSGTPRPRLIWKGGAGSGNWLDVSHTTSGTGSSSGCVLEDVHVLYDNAAYNGTLINYKNHTGATQRRVFIGATGAAAGGSSAKSAFTLNGVNTFYSEMCWYSNVFQETVRGRESGAGYSNVVRFINTTFTGGLNASICNPGLDWVFDHCIFEMFQGATKPQITTDIIYTGDQIQLTLLSPAWWDAQSATQTCVVLPEGNYADVYIEGTKDHNNQDGIAKLYDIQTGGTLTIVGGGTRNVVDVGNAASAGVGGVTPQKKLVSIYGFDIDHTVSKTSRLLNVNSGHHRVDVDAAIGGPNNVGVSGQVRTFMHERLGLNVETPTVTDLSGGVYSYAVKGNDGGGFVIVQNATGSPGPTGLVARVNLATTIASHNIARGLGTAQQLPVVLISSFIGNDAGANWPTPTAGAYWTVHPEVESVSIAAGGLQTQWKLRFNVALPAGQVVGIAYRVMHH